MKGIPQGLLDKYNHMFICTSLQWTLSSGQKPVCIVKILVLEQIAFAAKLYFGQIFVITYWPDLQTLLVETIPCILFLIKKRRLADVHH